MKILVVNGPNIQLLGKRKPEIYGKETLNDIENRLLRRAKKINVKLSFFQSCVEGELTERIGNAGQDGFDGIIVNPAAYTHTSVALRDAIEASGLPSVEVHISNVYKREEFRRKSLTAPVCEGQICGFGAMSYELALEALVDIIKKQNKKMGDKQWILTRSRR